MPTCFCNMLYVCKKCYESTMAWFWHVWWIGYSILWILWFWNLYVQNYFITKKQGEVYIARSQHLGWMTLDHDILHMKILLVQNDYGMIYGCDSLALIILGTYFAQLHIRYNLKNNLHVQSTFPKFCFEMIILVFNTPF